MRVIEAPQSFITQCETKVFLAGGISNCENWQEKVVNTLSEQNLDNVVLFNPRRKEFDINNAYESHNQILLEFTALENCDIFTMYFAGSDSVQPICLYELGRNILRMQTRFPLDWENRIIITVDENYKRYTDVLIQVELATNGMVEVSHTLDEHINRIIKAL